MKIKFGSIVVAGSGKIGGHVASKNRGGAYLRTKVTPSNPNTSAQAQARSILGSLSTAYGGLTDAQRQSWNDSVNAFASTDIFGDSRNPSGVNLFVKLNANLLNAGLAVLNTAPVKEEVPFALLQTVTFDLTGSELLLAFENNNFNNVILQVRATAPLSQGTSFVKSQLRNILVASNSGTFAADLYAAYVSKFGTPLAGQNIVFTVQPIIATGQSGIAQKIKADFI